ncbi:MAG: hypothetical protein U1F61_19550 [Opitutaceae bacterium]
MNFQKSVFLLTGFALLAARAFAADLAPTNFSSVIFNGTITSATGGANAAGTVSSLFASNGIDYTLMPNGTLTDPVAFTYTKTGANTGRITEAAVGTLPAVNVALTFATETTGTFVASYGNASTQSGTFSLVTVAFSSPLLNVSTRTTLAANGSAITGFIIGGSGPRRVLIRAVGPGLARFGVPSPLANPSLILWKGNTQIGANDDFSTGTNVDTTLSDQFAVVGAFPLTLGSRDAALAVELEPGAYTAQIRGSTATETGEVLLEVYFLN